MADVPETDGGAMRASWVAWFLRHFRAPADRPRRIARTVAEIGRDHDLSEEHLALLGNLLKLETVDAADVMVPRADILAVSEDAGLDELLRMFREAAHSRLPVYRRDLDDIVGMVHVKDLLPFWGNGEDFRIGDVQRPVLVTAPSSPAVDLLRRMRTEGHMAIVVDEHGGTDGLVTIEDLVEEIVGEIEDEHDREVPSAPALRAGPGGDFHADARVPVADLEKAAGVSLRGGPLAGVDSLGGLVVTLAGGVPLPGQSVTHSSGLRFLVVEADNRRVRRVRVTRPGHDAA